MLYRRSTIVALALSLAGGGVYADEGLSTLNASLGNQIFDDVNDVQCTPGQKCDQMPQDRGLCVQTVMNRHDCWDVCNLEHLAKDYHVMYQPDRSVNTGASSAAAVIQNEAFSGLVSMVRAGMNSKVQCPGGTDRCPPGKGCPAHLEAEKNIPVGRGMCVVDEDAPGSRACWDKCDRHKQPFEYTTGTRQSSEEEIWQVRQGGGCPQGAWWPWIIGILIIVALAAVCIAGVFHLRQNKNKGSRSKGLSMDQGDNQAQQSWMGDRYMEEQQEQVDMHAPAVQDRGLSQDFNQQFQQQDYGQGYGENPMIDSAFNAIDRNHDGLISQSEFAQAYQDPQFHDMLPPEPPRGVDVPSLPPAPGSFPGVGATSPGMGSYFDRAPDPQAQEHETFQSTGSMRIPGLDEPKLFTNMPSLIAPGSLGTTQAASWNQPISGNSQSQVMPTFNFSNPGTFQTQPPSQFSAAGLTMPQLPTPAGVSPPASMQLQPGVITSGGQQWFTQLQRR